MGGQKVDGLNTGLQHFGGAFQLCEAGSGTVNRPGVSLDLEFGTSSASPRTLKMWLFTPSPTGTEIGALVSTTADHDQAVCCRR